MTDDDLAFTAAVEQAAMIRRREISSVELVECYLRRIEQHNDRLGAFVTVAADQALDAAHRADRMVGGEADLPPLLGVPVSVKDLNETAGIRTTHGTAEWADRVPDRDDAVVARMRRAGCVILGKTIVPEFGTLNVSEPPAYPPGRNPWAPEHSAGGSSGGAAAAASAGLCALSQGSDAGGSIRIPSAWSGCYGIKPSRGRVPWGPPPDPFLWVNGPITRTVADAAALLDALARPRRGDSYTPPAPARPFAAEVGADPGRLRIAVHPHPGRTTEQVAPAHRRAVEDVAVLLTELGHQVIENAPARAYADELMLLTASILAADEDAQTPTRPPEDTWDPWNRTLVGVARAQSATDLAGARQSALVATHEIAEFFSDHDLLVTPTVAQAPPAVGWARGLSFDDLLELAALTPFTGAWNLTGHPAASLPLATDGDGFPVGVQVIGAHGDEATVLRVSAQLEAARSWADRHPPGS